MKTSSIHSIIILTVAACSYVQIGCDGDNPASVPHNSQPVIEEIPDEAVHAGTETTVQVQVIDSDVDDTHTISAVSGDTTIATVSVSDTTLVIRGIEGGEVTITISVTDDSGRDNAQSESITFQVTVAEPPPLEPGKFSEFNGASPDEWRTMHANGQIVACQEGLRLPRDSFCLDENFRFSADYSQVLDVRFLVAHLPDGDGFVLAGNSRFTAGGNISLGWITLEKMGSERVITHLDP